MTTTERLRAAGCVFAEDEAELLEADGRDLETLVQRREAGEPLEVILGWVSFAGIRVMIDPGVFVPRQRTAYLANQAIKRARPGDVVVDLCCGAGAIGAAVEAALPSAEVHASDIEHAAVVNARRNLARVYEGDLFEALPASLAGRVDILVVNAPYVPTAEIVHMPREARDFEPLVTLDGGEDGVAIHRRIAAECGAWLSPTAHVLVETSRAQAPLTAAAFESQGFTTRVKRKRGATVVVAQRPS